MTCTFESKFEERSERTSGTLGSDQAGTERLAPHSHGEGFPATNTTMFASLLLTQPGPPPTKHPSFRGGSAAGYWTNILLTGVGHHTDSSG